MFELMPVFFLNFCSYYHLSFPLFTGQEIASSIEPVISPLILNTWVSHVSDPFISIDAIEVLEVRLWSVYDRCHNLLVQLITFSSFFLLIRNINLLILVTYHLFSFIFKFHPDTQKCSWLSPSAGFPNPTIYLANFK